MKLTISSQINQVQRTAPKSNPTALPRRHVVAQRLHHVVSFTPRPTTTRIHSTSEHEAVTSTNWWKTEDEHWVKVHSEEEYYRELESSPDKLVLVDFFATWCKACAAAYPKLSSLASDPAMRKCVKFIKVNSDELKPLARKVNAVTLPHIILHRPGVGEELSMNVNASRFQQFRQVLDTVVMNPTKHVELDPNGFAVVKGDRWTASERAEKKEEKDQALQAMSGEKSSMFEHLMKMANASSRSSSAATSPASSASSFSSSTPPSPPLSSAPVALGPDDVGSKSLARTLLGGASSTAYGNDPTSPSSSSSSSTPALSPIATYNQLLQSAKRDFLRVHREDYGYEQYTHVDFDSLFRNELGARMRLEGIEGVVAPRMSDPTEGGGVQQQHYLDYTGSSMYVKSQIDKVFSELSSHLFGNPHSANPSSSLSTRRVEEARDLVLQWLNASPADYHVIFTRSATGALKLLGESFPWSKGSSYSYLRENHNSVLGMREYAQVGGASFNAMREEQVESWLKQGPSPSSSSSSSSTSTMTPSYNLFAFPAESNFDGAKFPLSWISRIQSLSTDETKWKVVVDAAAFVPTNPLDLSKFPADFVCMSFYKVFGYPTGLGALVVRTEDVDLLKKLYWGGGSVALATSSRDFHVERCRPSDRFEDGTPAFLDILALRHGFEFLSSIGGMTAIQRHTMSLTGWLVAALSQLRHSNGKPVVKVFGKHFAINASGGSGAEKSSLQGSVINFAVLDKDSHAKSYKEFEQRASSMGLHVRTGAECNPGACYAALGLHDVEIESLAGQKEGCDDSIEYLSVARTASTAARMLRGPSVVPQVIRVSNDVASAVLGSPMSEAAGHEWVNVPLGTIRVSLGHMSRFEDAFALLNFVQHNYIE